MKSFKLTSVIELSSERFALMSVYRSFLYAGLFFVLFFLSSAFSASHKIVKFGVFDASPLISIGDDGRGSGVFSDFLEAVASEEGWKIEYVSGTFAECMERGKNGEVDLIGSIMHMKDREEFLDFNESSILIIWGQVFVGLDSDISMIFDLAGKRVGVMKGGAHGSNFINLAKKFDIDCEIVEYRGYAEVTEALHSGQVDAGVYASVNGHKYEREGVLKQTSIIFNPTRMKFATAKGTNDDILKAIDTHFNKWEADTKSEYYKILDKWFNIETKEVLPWWVLKVVYAVVAVLVIAGVFVFVLRHQVNVRTEALLESEKYRKRIVDSLIDTFLYRHDTEGVLNYVSSSITQVLGYSNEEFLTHYTKYLTDDPINQEVIRRTEESIRGVRQSAYELQVYHKDKSVRWFKFSETPVFDKDDKVIAVEGVAHDITDRVRYEKEIVDKGEQLRATNQQLVASEQQLKASNQQLRANEVEREGLLKVLEFKNRELQDVVYTASHDLKSPLVNISGFSGYLSVSCEDLQRLTESIDDPLSVARIRDLAINEIPESLGFITSSVDKMKSLIDGLLRISRIGTAEINIVDVDMNDLLGQVRDAMGYQLRENVSRFHVGTLPVCCGDVGLLNQVFTNLIDNATKYRESSRDCEIEVSGEIVGGEAFYCVRDNGIGVKKAFQGKVFEIFHRLDPEAGIAGEGLGLTIVTRIVDRLGGRIWLESESGVGCEFFVALPSK